MVAMVINMHIKDVLNGSIHMLKCYKHIYVILVYFPNLIGAG